MMAVVVYTGFESKIILNQGHYSYKVSALEKSMNFIFIFQLLQIALWVFVFTLINYIETSKEAVMPLFDITEDNKGSVTFYTMFAFFLMLMRLVPLDLIINTEVSKIVTSKFMQADATMTAIDTQTGDLVPMKVQSMQLPEELGCVNHIFCDKTGTLTKNELEFRGISFNGHLCSGDIYQVLQQVYEHHSWKAELLFKCFVICHDIIPMTIKGNKVMSGTSQDELIAVDLAA